ncbi:MAG: type II secretion system protein [Candidatus Paceibacterota bacterium]
MFKIYKKNKKGFTLIELLVVVAIIGLLSSIVLTSLQGARSRGRDAKRTEDMSQLQIAIELYASDHNGDYPLCGTLDTSPTACSTEGSYTALTNLNIKPYIASISSDPINTKGQYGYYYARGWKPSPCPSTPTVPICMTGSKRNYIIGTRLENSSSPTYSGWGNGNLNFLRGGE